MKLIGFMVLAILFVWVNTAYSAIIIVDDPGEVLPGRVSDNSTDGLTCRLRHAVIAAGKNVAIAGCVAGELGAVDEIILAVDDPIQLMGPIQIFSSVRIRSAEGLKVHIIGSSKKNGGSIFHFSDAVDEFHLDHVKMTGGDSRPLNGGAISFENVNVTNKYQKISITNSVFEDNQAAEGGALSFHRTLANLVTIKNNVFINNHSTQIGGAISGFMVSHYVNEVEGEVPIFNLDLSSNRFESNSAGQEAGALVLFNSGEGVLIKENTFINNNSNGEGGAITLFGLSGDRVAQSSMLQTQSTGGIVENYQVVGNSFLSNVATNLGGAVFKGDTAAVNAINNTFAFNQAKIGGAVSADGNSINLLQNTFVDNIAIEAEHLFFSNAMVTLKHNVFAGGGNADACASGINTMFLEVNSNAINNQSCLPLNQSSADTLYGSSLLSGPVVINDLTAFRPKPGSALIDYIHPVDCVDSNQLPLLSDQWGHLRPTDGDGNGQVSCDIGAIEALDASDLIWFDGFGAY